jgi:hypothetical protein
MSDIFEQASRNKTRFDFPKGILSVEDLWDLPLTSATGKANLDFIERELRRQLKESEEESFVVKTATTRNASTQLKFDLVRHVILARLAENEALALAKANKEKKQQLMALIVQKENEQLSGTSLEELRKMVESMQ